jgi:pSer/pThr/pTyr-binding forkhead associated (FHA) protein
MGRGFACAIQLTDPTISRRHALFRYAEGAWYIQDQGSKSGTFVNGKKIQAARLSPGDSIEIGDTKLIFQES